MNNNDDTGSEYQPSTSSSEHENASNNNGASLSCYTAASNHVNAANILCYVRGLQYHESISPNNKPRIVDDVWMDLVGLFKEELSFEAPDTSDVSSSEISSTCPDDLKDVLKKSHKNETAFSIALFQALRSCLIQKDLIDETVPDQIVFKHGQSKEYAIGITRERNGEPGVQPTTSTANLYTKAGNTSKGTDSVLDPKSKCDHCSCILKKDNGTWKVEHSLSVVELKMAGEKVSCRAFKDGTTDEKVRQAIVKFLHCKYGSLAQVMVYTMSWVLPSLSKIGQLREKIPWCVIVGNKEENTLELWCRWASGNIYVPEKCGDHFKYAMTGFEGLKADEKDETVNHALSVYINTILFGLQAAKVWLVALSANKTCSSVATSGQKVFIGETVLSDLVVRGRPGKLSETDPNYVGQWNVNQGEIFTGKLDFSRLRKDSTLTKFFCFCDKNGVADVVAKVFSSAVHNCLIPPTKSWDAFEEVHKAEQAQLKAELNALDTEQTVLTRDMIAVDEERAVLDNEKAVLDNEKAVLDNENAALITTLMTKAANTELQTRAAELQTRAAGIRTRAAELRTRTAGLNLHSSQLKTRAADLERRREVLKSTGPRLPITLALSDVLLAVHKTSLGLITIMKNLSPEYKALSPKECVKDNCSVLPVLPVLWKGFVVLLKEVLVPLAELGLVHPDIRPGYDETSNILYKMKEKEGGDIVAVMKLTDYESILKVDEYVCPNEANSLYIEKGDDWNAKKFLWWQCVAIAYAWTKGKDQKKIIMTDLTELMKQPPEWLNPFLSTPGMEMTQDLACRLQDGVITNDGNNPRTKRSRRS